MHEPRIGVNQALRLLLELTDDSAGKRIEVHQAQKIAILDIATNEAKSADALTVSLT
jgi:hypothetical protein